MIMYKRLIQLGLSVMLILSVLGVSVAAAQNVQVIPISPSINPLSPSPLTLPQQTIIQPKVNQPAPSEQQAPSTEKTSEFEQYVSGTMSPSVATNIRQFGYDLFTRSPSSFAPVEEVPVGPDYIIGPGDEIKVSIWGSIEGQWTSVVDRDGTVCPNARSKISIRLQGPGTVAGMDNGDPTCHEPIKATAHTAFHGLCLAVIRAGHEPGAIRLTAAAAGLTSADATITTSPAAP